MLARLVTAGCEALTTAFPRASHRQFVLGGTTGQLGSQKPLVTGQVLATLLLPLANGQAGSKGPDTSPKTPRTLRHPKKDPYVL